MEKKEEPLSIPECPTCGQPTAAAGLCDECISDAMPWPRGRWHTSFADSWRKFIRWYKSMKKELK